MASTNKLWASILWDWLVTFVESFGRCPLQTISHFIICNIYDFDFGPAPGMASLKCILKRLEASSWSHLVKQCYQTLQLNSKLNKLFGASWIKILDARVLPSFFFLIEKGQFFSFLKWKKTRCVFYRLVLTCYFSCAGRWRTSASEASGCFIQVAWFRLPELDTRAQYRLRLICFNFRLRTLCLSLSSQANRCIQKCALESASGRLCRMLLVIPVPAPRHSVSGTCRLPAEH